MSDKTVREVRATIYLVVAVNRAICWFETEPEATARAARMTVASAKWAKWMPICLGEAYTKALDAAREGIGDDQWYPPISTVRYQVCVVLKGTP